MSDGTAHVDALLDAVESHLGDVHDAMVGAKAFAQTIEGVRSALESGVHVITNSTITNLNADTIEDTVSFLHELGLRTFAMNGMIYSGGGDANPDAIPQERLPAILVKVRDTAEALGLRTAAKPDSQDVCFITRATGRGSFLGERMAKHKVPRLWYFVDDFPLKAGDPLDHARYETG